MKKLLVLLGALITFLPQVVTADDLDLEKHADKVVVLDFWASWCVPCRRSFPWMNEMQEKYAQQGLVIIAVNVDRERENAEAFLAEYPAAFEIIYDPTAALAKSYKIQVMPSSFVIGRDGAIIEQHIGFKVKKQDDYEAIILAALKGNDGTGQ